MVEVTLLGTGGSMPLPTRYLSATLLHYKGRKILIDCGEGTQVSMREINSGFKSLDVICLTHLHGDHINGLPGLLATVGNSNRTDPLIIIGPIGTHSVLEAIKVLIPYLPFDLQIIEKGFQADSKPFQYLNGEIEICTLDLNHSSPCLGYRFEVKRRPKFDLVKAMENKVPKYLWNKLQKVGIEIEGYKPEQVMGENRRGIFISLVTDTRPIDEIIDFVEASDLFICEGTYGDDEDKQRAIDYKHMTFSEAATLAKKAKVKKLMLTHFGVALTEPGHFLENATKIFKCTEVGKDHFSLILTFDESSD